MTADIEKRYGNHWLPPSLGWVVCRIKGKHHQLRTGNIRGVCARCGGPGSRGNYCRSCQAWRPNGESCTVSDCQQYLVKCRGLRTSSELRKQHDAGGLGVERDG